MLTCGKLSSLPALSSLRFLTGETGRENPIRWFYSPEGDDFLRWVHGGELLIVSGAFLHRPEFSLRRFLHDAMGRRGLAGALFLSGGGYLKNVPSDLIAMAKRHRFPLMTIPWNVPLVDIEEEIARRIAMDKDENTKQSISASFLQAILGELAGETLATELQDIGYPADASQLLIVYRAVGDRNEGLSRQHVLQQAKEKLRAVHAKAIVCHDMQHVYLLLPASENVKDILTALEALALSPMGVAQGSLSDFPTLLAHARIALQIAGQQGAETPYFYQKDGLDEFLLSPALRDTFTAFSQAVLAPLKEAGPRTANQILATLAAYFDAGGNTQRAASNLYIHRNTLKYRLNHSEKLLGVPITPQNLRLALAVHIERLLESEED